MCHLFAGEYASAIETLVTAISLIKQSKVSSDDRCKILISSLQDTLHGIEAKSYGHGGRRGMLQPFNFCNINSLIKREQKQPLKMVSLILSNIGPGITY